MTAPGTTLSQSTGRSAFPPAAPEAPHLSPAATGAAAGTLHLTPAEEEAVAAYIERVWQGATGLSEVPSRETLTVLAGLILRKARAAAACRAIP